jgi:hypothetical protein
VDSTNKKFTHRQMNIINSIGLMLVNGCEIAV